jgi:hypothetical protein
LDYAPNTPDIGFVGRVSHDLWLKPSKSRVSESYQEDQTNHYHGQVEPSLLFLAEDRTTRDSLYMLRGTLLTVKEDGRRPNGLGGRSTHPSEP